MLKVKNQTLERRVAELGRGSEAKTGGETLLLAPNRKRAASTPRVAPSQSPTGSEAEASEKVHKKRKVTPQVPGASPKSTGVEIKKSEGPQLAQGTASTEKAKANGGRTASAKRVPSKTSGDAEVKAEDSGGEPTKGVDKPAEAATAVTAGDAGPGERVQDFLRRSFSALQRLPSGKDVETIHKHLSLPPIAASTLLYPTLHFSLVLVYAVRL